MLMANLGYVIVEVLENSNKVGTIHLPDSAVKPSNRGVVVDDGSDESEFNPGRIVYFPQYAGHKIDYLDKEYLVLKEEDVLAYDDEDLDEEDA